MNELSTEVKAQEVHEKAAFWHNRAEFNLYKFLLEIKKLRDERLYKELGYSTFEEYCSEEWRLSRETVYKKIQAAEKMNEQDFVYYSTHFGDRKTYFLTTMTAEQKERSLNEGVPTEQGYKSYDKATQKEIAEYKRNSEEMERKAKEYEQQLKQRDEEKSRLESQLEQAQRSESVARKQLESEQDKEPEVIERYMEPEDYQQTKDALKQSRHERKLIEGRNAKLEKDIEDLKQRRDETDEKSQKYDELNKAINSMNTKLTDGQRKLKAQKEVYDYVKKANELIREVAPMSYFIHDEYILDNEYALKPIKKIADDLQDISNKIKKRLNQGDVIDV